MTHSTEYGSTTESTTESTDELTFPTVRRVPMYGRTTRDLLNCPACGEARGLRVTRVTGARPVARQAGSRPPVPAIEDGVPSSVRAREDAPYPGRQAGLEASCDSCGHDVAWAFFRDMGDGVLVVASVLTSDGWEVTGPCLDCDGARVFAGGVVTDHCTCGRMQEWRDYHRDRLRETEGTNHTTDTDSGPAGGMRRVLIRLADGGDAWLDVPDELPALPPRGMTRVRMALAGGGHVCIDVPGDIQVDPVRWPRLASLRARATRPFGLSRGESADAFRVTVESHGV